MNYIPDPVRHFLDPAIDAASLATMRAKHAQALGGSRLLREHVADYRGLFDTMSVELGTSTPVQRAMDTAARIDARAAEGAAPDPKLEAAYLQFGRYLTIAGSRDGLPTGLQGLWLDDNHPPWMADYHTDVNLQMNYWLPDRASLGGCFDPLTEYCLSQYPSWRRLTRKHFNDPRNGFRNSSGRLAGWTVAMSLNIYGGEGWWWQPASNAWLCNALWQHYQYTLDRGHLARIYPLMKGACEFWEARLVEVSVADPNDGSTRKVLVDDHDWSPEQGPTDARGVSYAQELVFALFQNYRQASTVLRRDAEYAGTVARLQSRLYLPQLRPASGRLEEWMSPDELGTPTHRHLSPLIGLFPGDRITVDRSPPALVEGARRLLQARGARSYGWANAWRSICWARLKDGDTAYALAMSNLQPPVGHGGIAPNLLNSDVLPPDSGAYQSTDKGSQGGLSLDDTVAQGGKPIFQIDANYGTPAAMLEMLLYSRPGRIEVLPALPHAWSAHGEVRGIRARGGFSLDIAWREGRATEVSVRSLGGTSTEVIIHGRSHTLSIGRGEQVRLL